MQLEINGIVASAEADEHSIRRELQRFSCEGDSFAILSSAEMTYMQVAENSVGGLLLEYPEGPVQEHYICLDVDLETETIVRVFGSFLRCDER